MVAFCAYRTSGFGYNAGLDCEAALKSLDHRWGQDTFMISKAQEALFESADVPRFVL